MIKPVADAATRSLSLVVCHRNYVQVVSRLVEIDAHSLQVHAAWLYRAAQSSLAKSTETSPSPPPSSQLELLSDRYTHLNERAGKLPLVRRWSATFLSGHVLIRRQPAAARIPVHVNTATSASFKLFIYNRRRFDSSSIFIFYRATTCNSTHGIAKAFPGPDLTGGRPGAQFT